MENGKIEFSQEQVNSIMAQCYAIHSIGCLLELDRAGDDEVEALAAMNREPMSNVISNAARVIKEKVNSIISAIEDAEHRKE